MKKSEKLLLEAARNLLKQDAQLGLSMHSDKEESSHHFWHQWEGIGDAFRLKIVESPFFESISSSFNQIHSYKYLDDPTFNVAFDKTMRMMGIPSVERENAVKQIDVVVEELTDKGDVSWEEKAAGWSPSLDELTDRTRDADIYGGEADTPFTGGGPAPKDNEIG